MHSKNKKYTVKSSRGFPAHWSVGAIIERAGKYLMIDRAFEPLGLAGVAGHVDEEADGSHEPLDVAIVREIKEETGLSVSAIHAIPSIYGVEVLWNHCRSAGSHTWWLFRAWVTDVSGGAGTGEPKFDAIETKGGGWHTPDELAAANLEPVWREWYERLGIIPRKPRVTICGSMAFAAEMAEAATLLRGRGWEATAPALKALGADGTVTSFTEVLRSRGFDAVPDDDPFWAAKRDAILEHFRWIDWCEVALVWNQEKRGVPGYIGSNTMMEIGWATGVGKKVVALNPLNHVVAGFEEAKACLSGCLDGDLNGLEDALEKVG